MTNLDLAAALVNSARAPLARAAVALLLQLYGLFDRVDVVDRWYTRHNAPRPGGELVDLVVVVDWHQVADDADRGAVPMSDGERAVLLVAASLAVGYRVDLASALPLLDSTHAAGLIAAVHSAVTGRDPIGTGYDRFAGQDERDAADELVEAILQPDQRDADREALADRQATGCQYDSGLCRCPSDPHRFDGCRAVPAQPAAAARSSSSTFATWW